MSGNSRYVLQFSVTWHTILLLLGAFDWQ